MLSSEPTIIEEIEEQENPTETDEYLEDEDWFGAEEGHIVEKTENIGGEHHEGDIPFAELGGEIDQPEDIDFEPAVTVNENGIEDGEGFEEDFDDYDDEMFVEFETFDDEAFEKMLALQKDLEPTAFEKAAVAEMADEKAAALTAASIIAQPEVTFEESKVEEEVKEVEHDHSLAAEGTTHFTDGEKDYEVNEFEPWMDQEDHALMIPYDEEEAIGVGVLGAAHDHDEETCTECHANKVDEENMSIAMTGFALFGVIAFLMWYMLKSCKNAKAVEFDSSNPNSRGRYKPASFSPYNDEDNESVP